MEKKEPILKYIYELHHKLKRNQMCDKSNLKNLTHKQLHILKHIMFKIDTENNISQKDLELHFNLRKSTITGILKTMEKNGFLKKETDKNDKRVNNLLLTEKSMNIKTNILSEIKNTESILLKNIEKNDIETFIKVIKQMIDNI